jgi:hypothetical protein
MIVTVFDFDDTLFPTSEFTTTNNIDYNTLSTTVSKLLSTARMNSNVVYIITNANEKWIQLCKEKLNVDFSNIVLCCGAEEMILDDMSEWKRIMFEKYIDRHFRCECNHQLVCFGDSIFDRLAALPTKAVFPKVTVKNFKFHERPTFSDLIDEQRTVLNIFSSIYNGTIDMDKSLSKKHVYVAE